MELDIFAFADVVLNYLRRNANDEATVRYVPHHDSVSSYDDVTSQSNRAQDFRSSSNVDVVSYLRDPHFLAGAPDSYFLVYVAAVSNRAACMNYDT